LVQPRKEIAGEGVGGLLMRGAIASICFSVHGVFSIVNKSFRARCADDAAGFGFLVSFGIATLR
jgi:hypothetical protein